MKLLAKALLSGVAGLFFAGNAYAQRYLSDYDSTLFMRDTLPSVIRQVKNLNFSGYIQPQWQWAQSPGAPSYTGGNFSEFSNNRFMLRRARVKIDYRLPHKNGKKLPMAVFSYQIDATERGVVTRDMFLRVYGPGRQSTSLVVGLVARPFGFEVNLSSSVRETPERGRMSQILMPTERDLGAMITYDPVLYKRKLPFKIDAGLFNGQGLVGTTDFDSYKDFISRVTFRPQKLGGGATLSGGLSLLQGGWRQATRYRWAMGSKDGMKQYVVDSSMSNIGNKAPRRYYGADVQLAFKHGWGKTELRAEHWRGQQPGTATTSTNPGVLPTGPTYIRNFDGSFFVLIQNIVNENNELLVKYDWYDPNRDASGGEVGKGGTNFTPADVRFNTLGIGYNYYFTKDFRVMFYYDIVRNERTGLDGYTSDLKDNIFTCRFHFLF
ncbi:MAG TPA: porin [Chitinophagaceae bacterium]|jgi:hypothetical protein|nr:porin [Chitinophagaceae bacterium]